MAYRPDMGPQSPPDSEGSSVNDSPISPPHTLLAGSDAGESSTHGTPPRHHPDIARSTSGGRGGCWTCRVRRKKCDEQRQGDSCQTCIRLKLKCLGWGPRRPEWMRDKAAVEAYKAEIKAQLSRAGMIRGQPRMPRTQSSSPSTQPYHDLPAVGGPGPGSLSRSGMPMDHAEIYGFHDPTRVHSPAGYPEHIGYESYGTGPYSLPQASSYTTPPEQPGLLFEEYNAHPPALEYHGSPHQPTYATPSQVDQNIINQQHVLYYFENVRKIQYIFAGDSVVDAIHSLIINEPHGAVTNAVCALASLHYTSLRVPRPQLDREAERATITFHENSTRHLAQSLSVHGQYTEADAVAALHLVSFSLFSAGSTDWRPAMEIACEWLAQSGIVVDENPKATLQNMSSASRFAAKATMWMDIFASISDLQPPRFLSLYRRLFAGGPGYWARARGGQRELGMEALCGCPDEVLLAIAETSALAHWKAQEAHNGSLSVRELIRRADGIERQLRQGADALPDSPIAPAPAGHVPLPHAPAQPAFPTDDMRRLVADIYRESSMLYLHTVLSDWNPGVPEIIDQVNAIMGLLAQLPASEVDRSLMFPLCFAGCLTDDRGQRAWLKSRTEGHKENIGSVYQIRNIIDRVWMRRDAQGGPVDWREVMRGQGWNLLLV